MGGQKEDQMAQYKYQLDEKDLPRQGDNIAADLPTPLRPPSRRIRMDAGGAQVFASPSNDTHAGMAILEQDPESPGSLGIAISEAVEDAATRDDTNYSLGSVLNHVLLHQTVIGQEAMKQMEMAGDYPDVVIGCVGGGSNYAGIALPFMRDRLVAGKKTRFVAAEPEACPASLAASTPTTSATRRRRRR